jgi:hypothetical protein
MDTVRKDMRLSLDMAAFSGNLLFQPGNDRVLTICVYDTAERPIGIASQVLGQTAAGSRDIINISVDYLNITPKIRETWPDTMVVAIGDIIPLHATCNDSLGSIVKTEWSFGGSPFSSATNADTTIFAQGPPANPYRCILRVTDNDGNITMDTALAVIVRFLITGLRLDTQTVTGWMPKDSGETGDALGLYNIIDGANTKYINRGMRQFLYQMLDDGNGGASKSVVAMIIDFGTVAQADSMITYEKSIDITMPCQIDTFNSADALLDTATAGTGRAYAKFDRFYIELTLAPMLTTESRAAAASFLRYYEHKIMQ